MILIIECEYFIPSLTFILPRVYFGKFNCINGSKQNENKYKFNLNVGKNIVIMKQLKLYECEEALVKRTETVNPIGSNNTCTMQDCVSKPWLPIIFVTRLINNASLNIVHMF